MGAAGPPTGAAFEVEQVPLAFDAAAVAGEASGGADDAMARDDDADRVAAVGQADRARRRGPADLLGELPVRDRLPIRDLPQGRPDAALERGPVQGERQVELGQLAREIGRELLGGGRERLVGRRHAHAEALRRRTVALLVHVEAAQDAVVGDESERSDGTVQHRVRPLLGRGGRGAQARRVRRGGRDEPGWRRGHGDTDPFV